MQADRPGAARALAARYGAWIVLKGAGSIVCDPAGACRINRTGNPGLATAGTGDVLAGILGSLLAQRIAPEQAVPGAVWLHGAAADALVTHGVGPIGLTAGELADSARRLRNSRA
ncbi:Nicotinamide nucleotide repair protein [Bordetella pertussis]|nr:Nicotinamide nucleotide repair protein [Bordetella pertussis]CFN93812.1 Nicotinamide nucleotide repair protein [Bordetella pertussis]CFP32280.1 Nicotinamide nucleotide repair protein [Bordetella pertussis]CPL31187.1 Nicotinamide nucleotide repair protein [Bordetella pertussis]CPM29000.1 Nicotinamide nucleotide repair protein [Bordetella pertussis]